MNTKFILIAISLVVANCLLTVSVVALTAKENARPVRVTCESTQEVPPKRKSNMLEFDYHSNY